MLDVGAERPGPVSASLGGGGGGGRPDLLLSNPLFQKL